MKNKTLGFISAVLALLLAALLYLSLSADKERYQNLFMAASSVPGALSIQTDKIEAFCDDGFRVTYEIKRQAQAQAVQTGYSVNLTGTNSLYRDIMGYPVLDGGFLTKAAWDAKNKHAVLNETAAFKLFGNVRISGMTLKIGGETWLVAGVIQDGDTENANIYVPSGITGGQADSLMILLGGEITESYVKNALKNLGVTDSNSEFISLTKNAAAFRERFTVAWQSALIAIIALLARYEVIHIKTQLSVWKEKLKTMYLRELAAKDVMHFLSVMAGLLLLTAGAGAALFLSLKILDTCLDWGDLTLINLHTVEAFDVRTAWLYDYQAIDVGLFAAFLIFLVVFLILALKHTLRKS